MMSLKLTTAMHDTTHASEPTLSAGEATPGKLR